MENVQFTFRPGLAVQQRQETLDRIAGWESVAGTGHVFPNSTDREQARLGYVYLTDGADAAALLILLRALPEVEHAEVPPPRTIA